MAYQPIENYGVIGDMHTVALVGMNGSIDWFCFPKGNKGNQNFEVSTEIDLAKYRSVSIWCRRFGVNFATAPLTPRHN